MSIVEQKHLHFPLTVKSIDSNGYFAGYASVFDVIDNQNDVILKGAFSKTLKDKDIKLLWQHRNDEPIGVFTEIYEDEKGLYVEGKLLLEVQRAREAYSLLKSGAINGMSIGYTVKDSVIDNKNALRILKEIDLWEISLVTFPSNPEAVVKIVKNTPSTVREFEDFLRDAGFSRKQAKQISIHGFSMQRDAEETAEFETLSNEIARAINILTT